MKYMKYTLYTMMITALVVISIIISQVGVDEPIPKFLDESLNSFIFILFGAVLGDFANFLDNLKQNFDEQIE